MSCSSFCSSSMHFVPLFQVLGLVPSLVSKKTTGQRDGFLVICSMLEVKEHLTKSYCENLNVDQWKH